MKFGVVQFPGSCDERDALFAARRVGDAELLWHADPDLKGVDAVIIPGGFSYGDYLRVGAIARFSPVMGEVERSRATAASCSGSATASRCCARPGLLPGALLPEHVAALRLPPGRVESSNAGHPVDARVRARGACCRSRPSTRPAATGRRRCSTGSRPAARSCSATRRPDFNGSARDIAGVCNAAGNVLGLMPHPEHAVDLLTGSADGLELFAAGAGVRRTAAPCRELGLTDGEYELIVEKLGRRAERGRARGLLA